MVSLVGGEVGGIYRRWLWDEGRQPLFWPAWSKSDLLVLEPKSVGIFPVMMNKISII